MARDAPIRGRGLVRIMRGTELPARDGLSIKGLEFAAQRTEGRRNVALWERDIDEPVNIARDAGGFFV
jgi:hypothetical protein